MLARAGRGRRRCKGAGAGDGRRPSRQSLVRSSTLPRYQRAIATNLGRGVSSGVASASACVGRAPTRPSRRRGLGPASARSRIGQGVGPGLGVPCRRRHRRGPLVHGEGVGFRRRSRPDQGLVQKSISGERVRCANNSSRIQLSATTRPCRPSRASKDPQRHAIEQMPRRGREGRRRHVGGGPGVGPGGRVRRSQSISITLVVVVSHIWSRICGHSCRWRDCRI